MKSWSRILFSFVVAAIVGSAVFAQDEPTLAELLADDTQFSNFFELVEASSALESLSNEELRFTVFAPTDEAFDTLELDTLLENADSIVLYHLMEGEMLADDLESGMELTTLSGGIITIGMSDEQIRLNDAALLIESIEGSNGVIHRIDSVLEASGDAVCIVSTDSANTVQVRVGPGENRGVVAFLPADVAFTVLGQATDNAGDVWFKLDKEEATPNRSNAEAWVAAADVSTEGNCDDVIDVNAPPVIPIISQPTPNPDGSTPEAPASNIMPSTGNWSIRWDATTNVTCNGTTRAVATVDVLGYTLEGGVPLFNFNSSTYAFMLFLPFQANGDGTYSSVGTLVYVTNTGEFTGTMRIDSISSPTEMRGRFFATWENCSATFGFTATHA